MFINNYPPGIITYVVCACRSIGPTMNRALLEYRINITLLYWCEIGQMFSIHIRALEKYDSIFEGLPCALSTPKVIPALPGRAQLPLTMQTNSTLYSISPSQLNLDLSLETKNNRNRNTSQAYMYKQPSQS